jgi:hypothetical protein
MLRHWSEVVVAGALAFCFIPAVADGDETSTISGTGQVVLRPKATMFRFQLALSERGDDMQQTEKSLDRKCEVIRKALLAAKATPGSIRVDTARLTGGLRAVGAMIQQQHWGKSKWQYQTPVQKPQQQFQSPGLTPGPNQEPQTPVPPERREPRITLQTQVIAEWPLQGSTAAQLLVEADGIVRRVHEQILPLVPRKKASGSRAISNDQGDEPFAPNEPANNAPNPNPVPNELPGTDDAPAADLYLPTYLFVGVISQEQLHAAYVRAFKEATADAAMKADIAGLVLSQLSYFDVSRPRPDGETDPFGSSDTTVPIMPGMSLSPVGVGRPAAVGRAGTVETINYDPSSLQYPVSVNVTFRMQPSSDRKTESK